MKSLQQFTLTIVFMLAGLSVFAQKRQLDNFRYPDQRGVGVFEAPKDTISTFDGVKVRVGGSSTLQFQALDHENAGDVELKEIGSNFNLATANLDLDVALAKGVRMHLRTYLSSRHHPEPYVKGGYFQIDNLDFISEGLAENLMKYATIKIGHMENNYGDAHFRRSDNAQAMFNPFVGNLIMDSFTTEVGAEVYYQTPGGFLAMLGMSNGKLNQSVAENSNTGKTGGAALLAKVGFDKQFNDDFRFRLTGSLYNTGYVHSNYLYTADRAGSRYYFVMEDPDAGASSPFRSGRFAPDMRNAITAIMFNPFLKYGGLEFFGTLELVNGKDRGDDDRRNATQIAGELLYRFGATENFYLGTRINSVSSELRNGDDVDITRWNLGGGWFMTKNILAKLEYVRQTYDGYSTGSILRDGKFDGFMVEAVISF
ncbi:hypothetical protein [Aegicerativicinus sediminis]|uniref:hypothetical protein n=1 Tax=Aegicerativicinus sediminis TaxID=2893202 RepID=UPI001E3F0CCE|nr:hypothetical protein [Aegicerativicinus sediminis]